MNRYDNQLRAAQAHYDNAYPYDDAAELAAEMEDETVDKLLNDPKAVAEADSWWSGTLDGDQYAEMESAIADLHDVDATKLADSPVITRLYRLAKVCHALRVEAMRRHLDDAA